MEYSFSNENVFETIFLELKEANFKSQNTYRGKKTNMHIRIKDQRQLRNKDKIFANATEAVYRHVIKKL